MKHAWLAVLVIGVDIAAAEVPPILLEACSMLQPAHRCSRTRSACLLKARAIREVRLCKPPSRLWVGGCPCEHLQVAEGRARSAKALERRGQGLWHKIHPAVARPFRSRSDLENSVHE